MKPKNHNATDLSRIIEMAWEDRTPFEAIRKQFGLTQTELVNLMRSNLKKNSFLVWRKRVKDKKTKHSKLRHPKVSRAYSSIQYKK